MAETKSVNNVNFEQPSEGEFLHKDVDLAGTGEIPLEVSCANSIDASFNSNDKDPGLEPDSESNVIEESLDKNKEEQGVRGILKQKGQYSESKHVDFSSEVQWIPFDVKKDFTIEIQIVKEFPKKIVSYRELFRKMAEEERAKKQLEEESSDDESDEETPQTGKFGKLSLLEPGMHRHQESVSESVGVRTSKPTKQPSGKNLPLKEDQSEANVLKVYSQGNQQSSQCSLDLKDISCDHDPSVGEQTSLTEDHKFLSENNGNKCWENCTPDLSTGRDPHEEAICLSPEVHEEKNVQINSNCEQNACFKDEEKGTNIEPPTSPNDMSQTKPAHKHQHLIDVSMVENINYDDVIRDQKAHSQLEIITEEPEVEIVSNEDVAVSKIRNDKVVLQCSLCHCDSQFHPPNGYAEISSVEGKNINPLMGSKLSPPLITISRTEGNILKEELLDGGFELSDGSEFSDELTQSTDVLDYSASAESIDVESASDVELNNNSFEDLRLSP